jgi:hypothetical protein
LGGGVEVLNGVRLAVGGNGVARLGEQLPRREDGSVGTGTVLETVLGARREVGGDGLVHEDVDTAKPCVHRCA